MGLALCHVLPRDNILRFCIVIMTSAFILQAIALGLRKDGGSVGTVSVGGLVKFMLQGDMSVWDAPSAVLFCDSNMKGPCDSYINKMTDCVGLLLAAFITCPIAVFIVAVFTAPYTATTARMVLYFWLLTLIPSVLTLVATAHFFNDAVPALLNLTAGGAFSRGDISNLLIASCALYIFNFLMTSLRLILGICLRPAQKQQMIESKDINGVVSMHMANDDWKRQNDMWDMHARSVHFDVIHKQPNAAAEGRTVADADSNANPVGSVGSLDEPRTDAQPTREDEVKVEIEA